MITRPKISSLLHGLDEEGISEWCAKHGVSEDALELVVEAFAKDREEGVTAICAFRVGVEAGEVGALQGEPSTDAQLQQRAGTE